MKIVYLSLKCEIVYYIIFFLVLILLKYFMVNMWLILGFSFILFIMVILVLIVLKRINLEFYKIKWNIYNYIRRLVSLVVM